MKERVKFKNYHEIVREAEQAFNFLYQPVDTSDIKKFVEKNKHLLEKREKIKNEE